MRCVADVAELFDDVCCLLASKHAHAHAHEAVRPSSEHAQIPSLSFIAMGLRDAGAAGVSVSDRARAESAGESRVVVGHLVGRCGSRASCSANEKKLGIVLRCGGLTTDTALRRPSFRLV